MTGFEGFRADGAKRRGAWTLLLVCLLAAGVMLSIARGALAPVWGFVSLALVVTTVFWLIRAQLASILLVFVSVLFVSVAATQRLPNIRADRKEAGDAARLARTWAASGRFDARLPIVVHLIFDEMMSPGAITDDLPGGAATRQALMELGEKHGFRIFDSVYSRYYYTSEALPNLMDREYLGRTGMDSFAPIHVNTGTQTYSVEHNAYFDDLAHRGYRTAVFQTRYIDFCANPSVDLCETFESFDPGGKDLAGLDAPTQRVALWQTVLRAYAPSYTSRIGQKILGRAYGLTTHELGVIGDGGRYDVHRFPEWFDRFTKFAAGVPRGTHLFAHFLVPHSPYLLLESCVLSGKIDAGYDLAQYPLAERAGRRSDYYARYLAQLRCVAHKLDDFMTAVGRSDNYRDAVIVVHGDHGSRISIDDILEDYRERDFVDNYGAFFAVRAPGVPAGVDCEFLSLPEAFRRYVGRGIGARRGPHTNLPVVVLSRDAGNVKVEAPMPLFGCAAVTQTIAP